MSALRIEAAGVEAAAAFAGLHGLCFPEPWDATAFSSLLAPPAGRGWLGRQAGEAVGFLALSVVADEAELLSFGVAPSARRTGAGRAIMRRAMNALQAEGVTRLWLEVAEDNAAARALYASEGFEAVARRPRYYSSGAAALVKCKHFASQAS